MSEHQKLAEVPKFTSNIEQIVRDQFPQTVDANGRLRDHPTLQILDGQSEMRQAQAWCNANLRVTYNLSLETEQKLEYFQKWMLGIFGTALIGGLLGLLKYLFIE